MVLFFGRSDLWEIWDQDSTGTEIDEYFCKNLEVDETYNTKFMKVFFYITYYYLYHSSVFEVCLSLQQIMSFSTIISYLLAKRSSFTSPTAFSVSKYLQQPFFLFGLIFSCTMSNSNQLTPSFSVRFLN